MFELLLEARELYLQDVILNGKRYDRYVDDFINSHRYINCNSAICRNCHEMNIHIVKGLLNKRFSDEKIEFLLKLEWWNWSEEEIFDNLEILTSEAGLEELMNKYSKRDEIN